MLAAFGVGGLGTLVHKALARSFRQESCSIGARRLITSTMHLSNTPLRCQAHQRAGHGPAAAPAAVPAAAAPTCVSLPRPFRGALASTSQSTSQPLQQIWTRMQGVVCKVRHMLCCCQSLGQVREREG